MQCPICNKLTMGYDRVTKTWVCSSCCYERDRTLKDFSESIVERARRTGK